MPRLTGRPGLRTRPEIESGDGELASRESQAEFSGAGADFEDGFAGAQQRGERSLEPAIVAQELVGQPQIATVVQRIRMLRRQGVEQLGFKRALHEAIRK